MSLEDLSGTGNRSLLIVHGRGMKPSAEAYQDLSMAALRAGLERDYPDCVGRFDALQRDLAYYGDLATEVLCRRGKDYDEALDVADRQNALNALREVRPRKKFSISNYDRLPGKSAFPEFMANLIAPVFSGRLMGLIAKDVAHYFSDSDGYGEAVRARLRAKLVELIDRGQRIALLTHGTGSVVAYDVLWQLSHHPDFKERCDGRKVEVWVTMGSPLGDRNIRSRLLGAAERGSGKFPVNVVSWHNVSAEDDYTSHDNTLADDFKKMLKKRLVSAVHDYKIYNLAVRYGKSNPHSSIGYFIHPRVAKILNEWLQQEPPSATPKYTL